MDSTAIKAGGMRIARRKRRSLVPIVSDTAANYITIVTSLNNQLDGMKDNDYIKFRDFSTKLVDKLGGELKRSHFKNRDQFKIFKGDIETTNASRLRYLFLNLFQPSDNIKIKMKVDNTKYIHKTFSEAGTCILMDMVANLRNCIQSKTYNPTDPAKEYNKDVFDQNCKILGICNERKIAFSLIKEQYEIKKHEVKDNLEKSLLISNTFISLRNQYENYLNSFHNKV
jgi:hypothetical protein